MISYNNGGGSGAQLWKYNPNPGLETVYLTPSGIGNPIVTINSRAISAGNDTEVNHVAGYFNIANNNAVGDYGNFTSGSSSIELSTTSSTGEVAIFNGAPGTTTAMQANTSTVQTAVTAFASGKVEINSYDHGIGAEVKVSQTQGVILSIDNNPKFGIDNAGNIRVTQAIAPAPLTTTDNLLPIYNGGGALLGYLEIKNP